MRIFKHFISCSNSLFFLFLLSLGSIPDPVHLGEVQRYLTKIKDILMRLKGFWDNVYSLLGTMKDQTFVNEDVIDDPDFKAEFVQSIQKASEVSRHSKEYTFSN